jgi:uncharacterized membrane protein
MNSETKSDSPTTQPVDSGKRSGCLWLILAGLAFIVLVFGIIIYAITRDQNAAVQVNERNAIRACWVKANDATATPTSRAFATESCKEMEKQYRLKFGLGPE